MVSHLGRLSSEVSDVQTDSMPCHTHEACLVSMYCGLSCDVVDFQTYQMPCYTQNICIVSVPRVLHTHIKCTITSISAGDSVEKHCQKMRNFLNPHQFSNIVIQKLCAISPLLAFAPPICAFNTELQKFPTNDSTVVNHSMKLCFWGLSIVNL